MALQPRSTAHEVAPCRAADTMVQATAVVDVVVAVVVAVVVGVNGGGGGVVLDTLLQLERL